MYSPERWRRCVCRKYAARFLTGSRGFASSQQTEPGRLKLTGACANIHYWCRNRELTAKKIFRRNKLARGAMKALRKMHASQGRIKPPVTLGHEFCGVVEKTGSEVQAVKAGDFVSAEMHVNCGHCHQCRVGEAHICQNLKIIGIDQDGAFAEFVKIPAANIVKLDPAIPERYGAILDPLGNAVHTVLAGPIAGRTALVTGCGPIGLMSIAVAKACGSSTVFATETNEQRRAMAKKMGADVVLNPASED